MEEERIDAVKNWPEPKSVHDIQVFLGFANFYCRFIQGFSRIAAPLTSMLRMSPTPTSATQKSMNLVDEFGGGNCGENEARAPASTKGPTRADYLSSDHVSYAVSNYLTPDAKKLLTNYVKPLLKRLSFNTSIRNDTSGSKLTRLGMHLVGC